MLEKLEQATLERRYADVSGPATDAINKINALSTRFLKMLRDASLCAETRACVPELPTPLAIQEWKRNVENTTTGMPQLFETLNSSLFPTKPGVLGLFKTYEEIVNLTNTQRTRLVRQTQVDALWSHYFWFAQGMTTGLYLMIEALHVLPQPSEATATCNDQCQSIAKAHNFTTQWVAKIAGLRDKMPLALPYRPTLRYWIHTPANLMWAFLPDSAIVDPVLKPFSGSGPFLKRRAEQLAELRHDDYGRWRLPSARELTFLMTNLGASAPVNYLEDAFVTSYFAGNPAEVGPPFVTWPLKNEGDFWQTTLGNEWLGADSTKKFWSFLVADETMNSGTGLPTGGAPTGATPTGAPSAGSQPAQPLLYRSDTNTIWPYFWAMSQPVEQIVNPNPKDWQVKVEERLRVRSVLLVRTYDPSFKPKPLPVQIKPKTVVQCNESENVDSGKVFLIDPEGFRRQIVHPREDLQKYASISPQEIVTTDCKWVNLVTEKAPLYQQGFYRAA